MEIFTVLLEMVEALAYRVSLDLFVLIGAFTEEVIAPIPSPLVMVLAGSLAQAQNQNWMFLIWLALIGAVSKTAGSWILYIVADKIEDIIIGRFGKFIGVTHKEIESIGNKLNKGWKDNLFVFFARALPIIPSAPVSLACGLIKLNMKTYLISTFLGTIVRNILYLYLGFAGLGNYKEIIEGFEGAESIGDILLLAVIAAVIVWAYRKRKTSMQ